MNKEKIIKKVLSRLLFGNSIKAYHGSPFDFDKFSFKNVGRNDPGDFGKGFYFDTDARQAVGYIQAKSGFLYTCTISLEKPYLINRNNKSKDLVELSKFKEVLNSGGLLTSDEKSFLSISRKYGSDSITKALTKLGYDGVVINWGSSKEVVAFDNRKIEILKKEEKNPFLE